MEPVQAEAESASAATDAPLDVPHTRRAARRRQRQAGADADVLGDEVAPIRARRRRAADRTSVEDGTHAGETEHGDAPAQGSPAVDGAEAGESALHPAPPSGVAAPPQQVPAPQITPAYPPAADSAPEPQAVPNALAPLQDATAVAMGPSAGPPAPSANLAPLQQPPPPLYTASRPANRGVASSMAGYRQWLRHTCWRWTGCTTGGVRPLDAMDHHVAALAAAPADAASAASPLARRVADLQARCSGTRIRLIGPRGGDGAEPEVDSIDMTGPVLAVKIHGLEGILSDPYIIKPVVRVHVVDVRTGRYLRPVAVVQPTQYPNAPNVMPHDAPPPPPPPQRSVLSYITCGACESRPPRNKLPTPVDARIPTRDDVVEPLATFKALNRGLETDVRALAAVASADVGVSTQDAQALAALRERIYSAETALLWNDTLVLNVPLTEFAQPHVVLFFEIVDDVFTLPNEALLAGRGYYRVAWGFLRAVDDDGKATFAVDSRVPLGFPVDMVARAEASDAAHHIATTVNEVPTLRLSLHAYEQPSWSDTFTHESSLPLELASPAAPGAVPTSSPFIGDVPSPDVVLQYRLRRRQLLPHVLRVSCFGAVLPAVRYVHVVHKNACTYTYINRDGKAVSYASEVAPFHHHHRRRHRRASIAVETISGTHGHSYRHHPALLRPAIAVRLPTDVPVSEPVFTTVAAARVAVPPPVKIVEPDVAATGMAAARRSRLQRGPQEPCVAPDLFITSVPTGKFGALCVAFSPDGILLAVGCADDDQFPIRLYDVDSHEEVATLRGHHGIIHDVRWDPSSTWLCSGSADGTARVWFVPHAGSARSPRGSSLGVEAIPTRAVAFCTLTPPSYVYVALFHPLSPTTLITGSFDRGLRVWSLPVSTQQRTLPTDIVEAMTMVTGSAAARDADLRGFIGPDPREVGALLGSALRSSAAAATRTAGAHEGHINAIEFDAPDESAKRMFSADSSGCIVVWDVTRGDPLDAATYAVIRELRPAALRGVPIVSIAVRPGFNQLAVLGHQNFLRLFDLSTYGAMRAFPNVRCASSRLAACFSPDGRYLACGSEDGALCMWDADTGAQLTLRARVEGGRRALIAYPGAMFGVAWHASQHLLALAAFGSPYPAMLVGHETV